MLQKRFGIRLLIHVYSAVKGRESSLSLTCLPGWGGYHVRFKGILQIVCVFIVTPTFFFSPKRALMAMILVLSLLWSFQMGESIARLICTLRIDLKGTL